jgi:hypothetical protein
MTNSISRVAIPRHVQNAVLLGNRHACCVCQHPRVQLHHIDGNPSNSASENIAALCLEHHDMASMQIGLTRKLQPDQIRTYKAEWEKRCSTDIQALSRNRFTFYYCIYKNPPRILEAYTSLSEAERKNAVECIKNRLIDEQDPKDHDRLFGMNLVPQINDPTDLALLSIYQSEARPSYLRTFKPHPADPNYSADFSSQDAMLGFHMHDLWYQVVTQTMAEARGSIPIEDLFKFDTEDDLDPFMGSLVTFWLSVRGKDIHIPKMWEENP